MSRMFWLFLALHLLGMPAIAAERPVAVHEILNEKHFDQYAREVEADRIGKFLIDVKTGTIRYFDANVYPLHLDFVRGAIYRRGLTRAEVKAYHRNYHEVKPDFILGYVTHHRTSKRWSFSFWESDRITPDDIRRVKRILDESFFIADLPWRPDSERQSAVAATLDDMAIVTNDEIYRTADLQALHTGVAVGPLRIVPAGSPFDLVDFNPDEIVVLQTSYADLPPVAGILLTTQSTPLSHVNLRARAWGIPNAAVPDAAQKHRDLNGRVVRLEVRADGYELRLATDSEREALAAAQTAATTIKVPTANLTITALAALHDLRRADSLAYGAKAANLGEVAGRLAVKVPPGIGIPFSAFDAHLDRHNLRPSLREALDDPLLFTDATVRRDRLSRVRQRIQEAPLQPALLDEVMAGVARLGDHGMFVRSSTNAEDLAGFNGAGLYDTVPNVRGRPAMEAAIKQVWASLYNDVAVLERHRFGVHAHSVHAAVLVQVGVDATASGVLISKNLYDRADDHTYTLNAKRGLGMRVVDGQRIPEQVLYDVKYPGARVISRSDDPIMLVFDADGGVTEVAVERGQPVLTERNARAVSMASRSIVRLFRLKQALDIEWLLVGDEVYVVQVRPFLE